MTKNLVRTIISIPIFMLFLLFMYKKDIEEMGIVKFNESCRSAVLKYAEEWKHTVKRMGRWVDMESSYKTMDLKFMESVWWVFHELWSNAAPRPGDWNFGGHRRAFHACRLFLCQRNVPVIGMPAIAKQ